MDRDVIMRGRTTWVGTSSLEVSISIHAIDPIHAASAPQHSAPSPAPPEVPDTSAERAQRPALGEEEGSEREVGEVDVTRLPAPGTYSESKILDAVFLMVARSSSGAGSVPVCPLSVSRMTASEASAFHLGEVAKERRLLDAERSLVRSPPTADEVALLHSLLMPTSSSSSPPLSPSPSSSSSSSSSLRPSLPFPSASPSIRPKVARLAATTMRSSSMTQPQERNTNGKMFGGSLMRGAYELARTVAYVFGGPGSRPFLVASDRIAFLSPVEVGSVLEFTGSVVYCEGHPHTLFQVQVETTVRDLLHGRHFVSNTFQFSFQCDAIPLRRVEPALYSEAMQYLQGRRLLMKVEERRSAQQHDVGLTEEAERVDDEPINEFGVAVHN